MFPLSEVKESFDADIYLQHLNQQLNELLGDHTYAMPFLQL